MKKAEERKIEFIADECVDEKIIRFLCSLGYKVESVWDLQLKGAPDEKLLQRAIDDKKVFITQDLDFCNILLYPPRFHCGLIVLKTSPETEKEVTEVLEELLNELKSSDFDKTLVIVDANKYRLRRE